MNEVTLTQSQLSDIARDLGLDPEERALVEVALHIHGKKHRDVFQEKRVKDMLRHLQSADLISSSMREKIERKVFEA